MAFSKRVIWITGASSGIGEALAYELCSRGYSLILSSRSADKLESVRTTCDFPDRVRILPLDLSDTDALPGKVSGALAFFDRVDVLVNNAGISQRSLILNTELSVYEQLMQVNYFGTVALTKALLPHFVKQKSGHFVTVTSLMGKFGSPLRSGYCGAKHALHGFFDVLRMEHARDGIDVTLICPGFVQTDIARNALTADGSPQMKQDEATAKGMSPERFALKMANAIESKAREKYIGGKEVLGVYLKRFLPWLLYKVVLKSRVV